MTLETVLIALAGLANICFWAWLFGRQGKH